MKTTAFSVTVAALAVVIGLPPAVRAQSATPPLEPSDFSAEFSINADQSTTVSLLLGNAPDRSHPGQEKGNLYENFDDKRVRTDFLAPDGTPEESYWFFYDKQRYYTYDYQTDTCTATTGFDEPMPAFFAWVRDASETPGKGKTILPGGGKPVTITHWKYTLPEGSEIQSMDLGVADVTPVSLEWRQEHNFPVRMAFDLFTPGAPDKAVFNLPAVCVE